MTSRLLMAVCSLVLTGALVGCASAPAGGEAIVRTVPFTPGERLVYALHNLAGDEVGRGVVAVRAGDAGTLGLMQEYKEAGATAGPATDATSVTVDAKSLLPRTLERAVAGRADPLRISAAMVADGSAVTVTREDEKPRTLRLGPNVYANETALWLWRTLPLADGYMQRYVSVDATEGAVALVSVTVKARERIEVPAGAFDTWRILVRGGRATGVAWINVEAPHQVVQWDNGAITFRLVEVGR